MLTAATRAKTHNKIGIKSDLIIARLLIVHPFWMPLPILRNQIVEVSMFSHDPRTLTEIIAHINLYSINVRLIPISEYPFYNTL